MYLRDVARLRVLTTEAGLTHRQLAERAIKRNGRQVTRQFISALLAGTRRVVSEEIATAIAGAVGVAPRVLFDPEPPREARRCRSCGRPMTGHTESEPVPISA